MKRVFSRIFKSDVYQHDGEVVLLKKTEACYIVDGVTGDRRVFLPTSTCMEDVKDGVLHFVCALIGWGQLGKATRDTMFHDVKLDVEVLSVLVERKEKTSI